MLQYSGLEQSFWGETITTAFVVHNCSPVTGKAKTPHEAFLTLSRTLRVFGCTAWVRKYPLQKRKASDELARHVHGVGVRRVQAL